MLRPNPEPDSDLNSSQDSHSPLVLINCPLMKFLSYFHRNSWVISPQEPLQRYKGDFLCISARSILALWTAWEKYPISTVEITGSLVKSVSCISGERGPKTYTTEKKPTHQKQSLQISSMPWCGISTNTMQKGKRTYTCFWKFSSGKDLQKLMNIFIYSELLSIINP